MSENWHILHVDGSCQPNPGQGSWAIIWQDPSGNTRKFHGLSKGKSTNNRMEIIAAIQALRKVPPNSLVSLYSDSQYLTYTVNNNWRTKANRDLWSKLSEAIKLHKEVLFSWIPRQQNQQADALARKAFGQCSNSNSSTDTSGA